MDIEHLRNTLVRHCGERIDPPMIERICAEMTQTPRERDRIGPLEAAIDPFARVWRLNAGLNPKREAPLRDYLPGSWPTMGDLRKLNDLLG